MILLRVPDPDLAASPFSGLWSAGTFLFHSYQPVSDLRLHSDWGQKEDHSGNPSVCG